MSGAETVAGLVLGILPLLISTVEHYDIILRPFKRYKNFAPEIGLYQQQLETQKTIFRNECMLVLSTLTDNQTAKLMLKGREHPSWIDSNLDKSFAEQLGDSGSASKSLIDLIKETLKTIEVEAENFGLIVQESMPLSSIGDKAWRSRVKKKLKFSIAEPRLKENIKNLRKHNQDLITLTRQTTKLEHQARSNTRFEPLPRIDTKIKERRIVHDASSRLYNALERACRFHNEHLVHLRLDPQQIDAQGFQSTVVRFSLGFTRHHGIPSAILDPVWIGVESIFNESTKSSEENSESQKQLEVKSNTLKHTSSTSPMAAKRIKISSVRFSLPTQRENSSSDLSLLKKFRDNCSLPGFCIRHDFCHELEKCTQQRPKVKYIGYFEKAASCKHLIYFSPQAVSGRSNTISLANIVSNISKDARSNQLPQYKIIRLAGQLASAVLQFYTTKILKKSWCSDDLVFFGKGSESASLEMAPHLQVHLGGSVSPTDHPINPQKQLPKRDVFIRNPYLFSLGVVLIELAYQAPISTLREESDWANSQHDNQHADYFAAIRLSEIMATSLGPAYTKVVRKCLWCDFGEGITDLGESALQASVYTNVVCELDRLEKCFAKLQLAD